MTFKNYKIWTDLLLIIIIIHSLYLLSQLGYRRIDILFKDYLSVFPISFLKIFGITLFYWNNVYYILGIFFVQYMYIYIKKENFGRLAFSLKDELLPTIISFFSSFFFINGLGNYFNGLFKRCAVQVTISLILDVIYFYWIYSNWSLPFLNFMNKKNIYYLGIFIMMYSAYVIYDTYLCTMCKYYDKPYPKFLGIKIEE
ncbi:hypothetical protein AW729_08960 [Methanosphaera sp. BMS]|nr:hypothetical protein AW729_08960 [Methanosphaera sp. BMS]